MCAVTTTARSQFSPVALETPHHCHPDPKPSGNPLVLPPPPGHPLLPPQPQGQPEARLGCAALQQVPT